MGHIQINGIKNDHVKFKKFMMNQGDQGDPFYSLDELYQVCLMYPK